MALANVALARLALAIPALTTLALANLALAIVALAISALAHLAVTIVALAILALTMLALVNAARSILASYNNVQSLTLPLHVVTFPFPALAATACFAYRYLNKVNKSLSFFSMFLVTNVVFQA